MLGFRVQGVRSLGGCLIWGLDLGIRKLGMLCLTRAGALKDESLGIGCMASSKPIRYHKVLNMKPQPRTLNQKCFIGTRLKLVVGHRLDSLAHKESEL